VALRPRLFVAAISLAAAFITLLVSVLPFVRFAYPYRSPSLHLVIETVAALIGLLAAYLVFGRFRESGQVSDLALVAALALFAFTNLFFSALPEAVAAASSQKFSTWAPMAARISAALVFAFAAFAPARSLQRPRAAALKALSLSLAALFFIAAIAMVLDDWLPTGIDPSLSPESSTLPHLVGHPAILTVQAFSVVIFAAAAVGFVRRAERTEDDLMTWFAGGAALAAFARLNYFLFPSLYSDWVYTGDFFRLGFYCLLLVGAGREINRYWRRFAEANVLDERRRISRDLHDGLAHELAFIATQARWLAHRRPKLQGLEHLAAAAERALDESRSAIAALTQPLDESLAVTLARAAEDVAGRAGARVRVQVTANVDVPATTREALTRIVREAVTNATRHGKASVVSVVLADNPGIRLRIVDNGIGFDRQLAQRGAGFGLATMAERARAVGGQIDVRSRPGAGTEVEVMLP
jgi:signal transduction histidine kinase